MFDQIWWEYILVTKTPTERALLWCWLTSSWFVEESHLFTNCINFILLETWLHVVIIHTRALHSARCSPILSWPRIMFFMPVCYDLFNCGQTCCEMDCFESSVWQIKCFESKRECFESLIECFNPSGWCFPSFPCPLCSPRSPNLFHVLLSWMAGWHNF